MVDLHAFVHQMPKVELHVHLEGSIRPATLLKLAQRNDFDLPAKDVAGLQDFYRFRDFAHFIEVYVTITRCLQTQDDYRLIAYEFGADCARQNVRYAEVTFSIVTNTTYARLPWQAVVEGLNAGRAQARAEFDLDWRWVFDIVRDVPETQEQVVEIALAARDLGVVALGLGGSEKGFPPELFARSFERARQGGLHSVPHAGEIAGPESIWNALKLLHAERVGHGVRCVEDPALVDYLHERQVPLEVCPTSNVRLGVYPDYEAHPLRRLWDTGLFITVNSDDPPLFNTDLNHEYEVLVDHFGFTAEELERVSLNGLHASFLPQAKKAQLEIDFQAQFARLREIESKDSAHRK
jgi:aminodeoxyfutalosine deaminase